MATPKVPFYAVERRGAGIVDGHSIFAELCRLYDFARCDVGRDEDGNVSHIRSAGYVQQIAKLLRLAADLLKLNDHEERLRELEALMGRVKPAERKPNPELWKDLNGHGQ